MSQVAWAPLSEDDLPALRELALACLHADGGLPLLADEPMLRRYFLAGVGIGGRDETGDLVAAAGVTRDRTGRPGAAGLVRPSARRSGLGAELAAWCAEHSGGRLLRVSVETTSPETEPFLHRLGLVRTFAEHVMRHDLLDVPRIRRPVVLRSLPWDDETAPLFHRAYRESFAERPGFPDTPLEEWVHDVADEPGFRPERSRVVVDGDGAPAGFVTLTDCWVDQVGVVPAWRGRALGAHLVARSLRALRKAGCEAAWLAVNVDNPAHGLYLRLGFADAGLRARYEQVV
ncbi:GNAT family N-acetyltransferase [Phycicoccus sonneratiae]|uniref:GNAT family N-acetyltransferase n=1 Tax=Phycicoccus sonneratiae TaxID=2807628 RepID=A0ABS2CKH5_9MICO|nr:GNAT family N-acetyltransferase [Phycicoccus sonneraticus]MBM6400382.1 GNAT family N-acetyltransferase [Phycicoccus sonneraticus]